MPRLSAGLLMYRIKDGAIHVLLAHPGGPYFVNKVVHAWAFEGDCDPASIHSNTFTMEWPPRSGQQQAFPEIDRAEFFDLETARRKVRAAQAGLIDKLEMILNQVIWTATSFAPERDGPCGPGIGRPLPFRLEGQRQAARHRVLFRRRLDRLAIMGDEFVKKSKELEHRAELFTAEDQPHGFFNRPPWQEKTTLRMDEFPTPKPQAVESSAIWDGWFSCCWTEASSRSCSTCRKSTRPCSRQALSKRSMASGITTIHG
jgi:predicted NUDIX family NTP pyrophosphohydrolase